MCPWLDSIKEWTWIVMDCVTPSLPSPSALVHAAVSTPLTTTTEMVTSVTDGVLDMVLFWGRVIPSVAQALVDTLTTPCSSLPTTGLPPAWVKSDSDVIKSLLVVVIVIKWVVSYGIQSCLTERFVDVIVDSGRDLARHVEAAYCLYEPQLLQTGVVHDVVVFCHDHLVAFVDCVDTFCRTKPPVVAALEPQSTTETRSATAHDVVDNASAPICLDDGDLDIKAELVRRELHYLIWVKPQHMIVAAAVEAAVAEEKARHGDAPSTPRFSKDVTKSKQILSPHEVRRWAKRRGMVTEGAKNVEVESRLTEL